MATARPGHQPVLLVVDVQAGVVQDAWEAPRVIGNVARAVERARAGGVPVVWVQHADDELPTGSAAWQWVPELVPAEGEALIPKKFNSSFEQTTLDDELARLGATHIVLAGAATNWCIRATAYGALERGYAAQVVQELNIAMTWLSYPGRRNGTATAEAVDFNSPGGAR